LKVKCTETEFSHAPTAHATNEHAYAHVQDGHGPSKSGFALIVDGLAKREFDTQDRALKAARELKARFPILQVKVYDTESKQSETIELAAA
jgi:hypothetical protein